MPIVTAIKDTIEKISPKSSKKGIWTTIIFIWLFIIIFVLFYIHKNDIKNFAIELVGEYGYWALFFICWAADVIIQPIPSDVVVFGSTFLEANLWKTAIVAGLSSGMGGATGYYIGKWFGPWRCRRMVGSKIFREGAKLFKKHGSMAIFIAGVTPIPYSAACWIGGIYRMSLTKVIVASWISRTLRYIVVAWLGQLGYNIAN